MASRTGSERRTRCRRVSGRAVPCPGGVVSELKRAVRGTTLRDRAIVSARSVPTACRDAASDPDAVSNRTRLPQAPPATPSDALRLHHPAPLLQPPMDTANRLPPALAALATHSPFIARLAGMRALAGFDWDAAARTPVDVALLEAEFVTLQAGDTPLDRVLRDLRARTMARLVTRDASGRAALDEVLTALSALATLALRQAERQTRADLVARFGTPRGADRREQHLQIVAMGKLGGGELNASSDIDLIFVYPEDGDTDGEADRGGARSIGNQEFFIRQGRALIGLLAEVTSDGMVFRVDMRLRPWGDAGPLALSHAMLEEYLLAHGRAWERYAWMKALAVTGTPEDEKALNKITQPFVYRKYLDFAALDDLRDLHRQIRAEVARRDLRDNIKLGPGGIREVEFVAQIFQLIRGGRECDLRVRSTREALRRLAASGRMPEDSARTLLEAYDFLRRLEHALQYVDDAQTQMLPESGEGRARVAGLMRYANWDALAADTERTRNAVTAIFEDVFEARERGEAADPLHTLWQAAAPAEAYGAELERRGFDPALGEHVASLRNGARYRSLSAVAQARLDALVPQLAGAAAASPARDRALSALLGLVEAIGGRVSYLALLQENPQALLHVGRLVTASSWLAQYLNRHPLLLDELLDPQSLAAPADWPALFAALGHELDAIGDDTEAAMDALRHFRHAQTFRLVARGLSGMLSLEHLADELTALADGVLQAVLERVWVGLRGRHRERPQVCVIGYGKLGGKELSFASDLDLVWVHDDDHPDAGEVYSRLVQRCNSWLNSLTGAGVLYETDLRLRPDGDAGLLVCSVAHWQRYLETSAWTWELQALTRARAAAGDADIAQRVEAVRRAVLAAPREADATRRDIVDMRRRMLDAHRAKAGVFNLKQDRGGIIDTEFVVQYWILAHAHRHPELLDNVGTLALLGRAAALGLADADLAARCQDAYRHFRQTQHLLRLNAQGSSAVPAAGWDGHRDAVTRLWDGVMGPLPVEVPALHGRPPPA
ncbi:MAG: bifunctional [glutamate--ammonia ligase]-adenylyl-L-tyrosine phosphorylase/[glutamate--ammonia-ligase] adenylyltransferase [Rhodocyclaceae bacterium]|nr:bifunctional [glutamate--ammonia ligase]-adenylyl-L-tyrosine phosphorylase/[glutamate--ammonia-ligase] adenylyltransferase [Rhodocyclaceae bacterium]